MEISESSKRLGYIIPFILLFLVFLLTSCKEEKTSIISFGADPEGETDQTDFIQRAIDYKSDEGGGTVFFPKGIYLIDTLKSVNLKNNITLEFEEGTVLKAIPNNSEFFQIINIHDVEDVKLIGKVKIQGERQEHLGNTGEKGMGISIRGSNNITIEDPIIVDNWGDGIYIGSTEKQNFSENIKIINPILDNNRRQGISIISAKNLEITNAKITNTEGTMPQGGLAFEPNDPSEYLKNIKIINLSTENNAGKGLLVYPGNLDGTNPVSIHVNDKQEITDGYSVIGIENLQGEIYIGGYYYLTDKEVMLKK